MYRWVCQVGWCPSTEMEFKSQWFNWHKCELYKFSAAWLTHSWAKSWIPNSIYTHKKIVIFFFLFMPSLESGISWTSLRGLVRVLFKNHAYSNSTPLLRCLFKFYPPPSKSAHSYSAPLKLCLIHATKPPTHKEYVTLFNDVLYSKPGSRLLWLTVFFCLFG